MFGDDHDIPSAEAVHLYKLNKVVASTDSCNSARLLSSMLPDAVEGAVGTKS